MEIKGVPVKNLEITLSEKRASSKKEIPSNALSNPIEGEALKAFQKSISEEIREDTKPSLQEETPLKDPFLKKINQVLLSYNKVLKIEIDDELKIPVYKIIDLETKEVLRQIPLEDLLKLKKALYEFLNKMVKSPKELKGILFEKEA